ncbi:MULTISPECIES: LemA family protein [unclassified Dehalobacter]|uniref:LemA family protein n=1 Tax=unclassified Dehalobacter TaxID=2635733 RepID=UPI000E6C63AA|nr:MULTISPECIES: LemA family protein [unclassified Dehalobacter]RJE48201.1 LemA family protein [Dehalobacter sp. MCB1]TCX49679.1 LemA family protein [Dehalobacter sp. 14DCB1]TCX50198.1 LemA family protein [Dehalobacter sp. 12DCB1]
MKKTAIVLGIILILIMIMGGSLIGSYNSLVTADENVKSKWSQVENQLQRRTDLIPNLVATVKGYAAHENEVFTAIADARSKLAGAQTINEKVAADDELSSALSRLLVIVENYPDLKANQNFIALQDELAGTENRLTIARQDYNEAVQTFNTSIKRFPKNIIAGMFNFESYTYYEAEEGAEKAPVVNFGE